MAVTCNLYDQWILALRQEFDKIHFDHSQLQDQECAMQWQSWQRRKVRRGARSVHRAHGFVCPHHLKAGLSRIEKAIENGDDLTKWQSKLTKNPSFEDGLFNDFNVTHFHLGEQDQPSGLVVRTKELLFGIADQDSMYEIGIYDHGEWFDKEILEIIDANWPSLLDRVTLKGVLASTTSHLDASHIETLRNGRVNVMHTLKSGRTVMPFGGGFMSSGISASAVQQADHWGRIFKNGEKMIIQDIDKKIAEGIMLKKDYTVNLHMTDDEIAGDCDGKRWFIWRRNSQNE